jgi:hypothetical protein
MENDPRGRTLWEMFRDWVQAPSGANMPSEDAPLSTNLAAMRAEPPTYNPLDLRPGDDAVVNGARWSVTEFRDVTRHLAQSDFSFADYGVDAEEPTRLRVFPADAGGLFRILLHLYEEFPFDAGFVEVLDDTTGVFEITDDDTGVTDRFERLHGVQGAYNASARKTSAKGESREAVKYWDWWRNRDGAPPEFVFVEQIGRTFQIWRGEPVQ